ncbi:MAG: hypothetical protein V7764_04735 [Pseudomonas marincola]|jgi:hypothetical protein|uniref:hypothetical protein n=1 Tax=Pseudomonas marincola TaxID=437900 RepID=UPI003002D7D2
MSEVVELVIRTEKEARHYFERALSGEFDNLSVLIKFDGWPSLDIDIEGDRYHSSLPTGVLKALVEYQSAINRAYASIAYGKTAKSMTEEDRKDVELVFNVREGSTDTETELWGTLTTLGAKAIERMTGKQLVITVLGAAFLASATYGSVHWMDTQAAVQADASKQEIVAQILSQNEHLAQLQTDLAKASLTLVKGAYDANKITYGDVELSKQQIEAVNQRGRETSEVSRIDGAYEIVQLKRFDDKWRIVLFSEKTGQIQTDLFRGQNAAQCIEEISLAFAKHNKVDLLVLGRYKAGSILSANILGSTQSGLLEPEIAVADEAEDDDSTE